MIYIVFLIAMFFSLLASKKDNSRFLIFIILTLGLFVGLRGYDVGDDTRTYYYIFLNLMRDEFSPNVEIGFSLLSYIILKIVPNITFLFCVYSIVINTFFVVRFWSLRRYFSFPIMIALYLILFYPQQCNILRQYIAISLIFYSTQYLEKGKYIRFCIAVLIAVTIHISAIVSFAYILMYILYDENISIYKKKCIVILLMALLPIAIIAIGKLLGHYSGYFKQSNSTGGLMNYIRITMIFMGAVLSPKALTNQFDDLILSCQQSGCKYKTNIKIIVFSSLIGVLLYFAGYYRTTMTRIGYYYGIFEIPFIARVVKFGRGRQIMALGYFLVFSFYFYLQVQGGWSELGAYRFFFQ